jgi:ATP adenylyltransferase
MKLSFKELKEFVDIKTPKKPGKKKMQMAHIYQPVMIKTLLQNCNSATADQIAKKINELDESNLSIFRNKVRDMPGRVLSSHGIVERDGNTYTLQIEDLSDTQREKLIELCDYAVKAYEKKFGLKAIWDYKSNPSRHISGTLEYDVISRAKGACEACHSMDKKLHVDHIIPVSWGGETEIGNLQALCYSCNTQKRNRDNTNFSDWRKKFSERDSKCIFCNIESTKKSNALAYAIEDKFPVTKYHTLIIPKRHTSSFFDLIPGERNECFTLMDELKKEISKKDKSVLGFNVGINDSEVAGQTIFHCHIHLIPRRKGDVENPIGGVRGVIPEKASY